MKTFKEFMVEAKKKKVVKKASPVKSMNFKLPSDQNNEYRNNDWTPNFGDNRVVGESYITDLRK